MKGYEDEEESVDIQEEPKIESIKPVKKVSFNKPSRSEEWKDLNPLLNPRLEDDIESGLQHWLTDPTS